MTLAFETISHRYGETEAVRSADLVAAAGEIVCLFGASGCGKTTLLRLAAGFERVQTGAIRLAGSLLASSRTHVPAERRPVGLVFQDYVLFPHMTVAENVAFGLAAMARKDRRARVGEELEAVGLSAYADRYPHMLSGGQQQRVAIARAFARRPQAMLLDEPFASIDAVRRRLLRDDVRALLKGRGAAAVLVTHDPEEALVLGDRIAIMKEGVIIETASPEALYKTPQTAEGAAVFPGSQTLMAEVRDELAQTAFGPLTAASRKAGRVCIVLREGAASVGEEGGPATVIDCRFAGPGWRVLLGSETSGQRLWATSPEAVPPGRSVQVLFDPASARIFSDA